ncbi:MAG: tetratricopeptide repeat protein [Algoriphagus aquaeductus]|uniref:tetratricopeptide repeat protein n=1 Tax=Algoriphagus aquaeductus TaxID=475299 RepID=UPI00391B1CCC
MKKSQLILVAVGIIAIVVLFSLPKVVVDNDATSAKIEDSGEPSDTPSDIISQSHENELSSQNRTQADQLIRNFLNAPTKEEKVTAAQILAGIYKEEGLFDSAAYYWEQAAVILPDNMFLAEEAGKASYEAFSFALDKNKVEALAEKTRNYLNKVLEKDPKRLDLKTKVAMTFVSSANPMQGITMLREVLEEDPQNEDGLFNMGVLSMQSGQYKRAADRFEELVKYHPQNIQGQFYLAVSYFEANEKNKAKAQFEEVKKLTQDPMILSSVQSYLERL